MSDEPRDRLAAEQARLVAALRGRDGIPRGFDADRIELAARTLAFKRRSGIANTWPVLSESLDVHFKAFGASHPPDPDGPSADGFAFASWLDARGALPRAATGALIAAQLAQSGPIGVRIRGGIVGVRLPFLGIRLFFAR